MKKKIFVFKCSRKKSTYGFTELQDGSNLPGNACTGKWQLFKTIDISVDTPALLGASPKDILEGTEKNGYYLSKIEVTFTETVVTG